MANVVYHPPKVLVVPHGMLNIGLYFSLFMAVLSFVGCQKAVYTIAYTGVALLCDVVLLLLHNKRKSFYYQAVCASLLVFFFANVVIAFAN